MPKPAAISAQFSDWRTVKGRKCLQLIFEVPLEQQGQVLDYLGAPVPDNPSWCGIAKLVLPDEQKDSGAGRDTNSQRQKQRYAEASEGERAVTRAALLCEDRDFQDFVFARSPIAVNVFQPPEVECPRHLRAILDIDSRTEIAKDPAAFLALETEYLMATGKMASPS